MMLPLYGRSSTSLLLPPVPDHVIGNPRSQQKCRMLEDGIVVGETLGGKFLLTGCDKG